MRPYYKMYKAITHLAHLQVAQASLRPKLAKELNFASLSASVVTFSLILISILFSYKVQAQTNIPFAPKPTAFKPITINPSTQKYSHSTYNPSPSPVSYPIGMTAKSVIEQQYKNLDNQYGIYTYRPHLTSQQNQQAQIIYTQQKIAIQNQTSQRESQHTEIRKLLAEERATSSSRNNSMAYYQNSEFIAQTQSYKKAFHTLKKMLTGKSPQSISQAYFAIEKAYGSTYLNQTEYNNIIDQSALFIQQWLLENKYDASKNEDLHYGIQRFMRDTLQVTRKIPDNNGIYASFHLPFYYDYIDFTAEKDFNNYFITKCIATGSGQCNSLPATYLALAEKLGAQTYLSFAPHLLQYIL